VGVDQSGDDARALRVKLVAIERYGALQLPVPAYPYDQPVSRGESAIRDAAQRIIFSGNHGCQLAGVPEHEVGTNHVARSIPCRPANAIAVS
jgi:hypothetical protein